MTATVWVLIVTLPIAIAILIGAHKAACRIRATQRRMQAAQFERAQRLIEEARVYYGSTPTDLPGDTL